MKIIQGTMHLRSLQDFTNSRKRSTQSATRRNVHAIVMRLLPGQNDSGPYDVKNEPRKRMRSGDRPGLQNRRSSSLRWR
jgi:hypothetical protein